ncbi:MAG: hypothetical protein FWC93_01935 [Defluviitaleaceae bacterium]|nr:hypothetical protein [Defluviitaleaceae bacterium]
MDKSIKYTKLLPKKQRQLHMAAQIAVFVPLIYGISIGDMLLQVVCWPLLILISAGSMIIKFRSYYQAWGDHLLIAPSKQEIFYTNIIGLVEHEDGIELEYIAEDQRHTIILHPTMKEQFLIELHRRMKD